MGWVGWFVLASGARDNEDDAMLLVTSAASVNNSRCILIGVQHQGSRSAAGGSFLNLAWLGLEIGPQYLALVVSLVIAGGIFRYA